MIKVLYLAPYSEDSHAFILDPSAFELTTVNSVEEGIEIAGSGISFDCIVADASIVEPDIAGLIMRIRSIYPAIPIVISSGAGIPARSHMDAISHGADYCVPWLDEDPGLMPVIVEAVVGKKVSAGGTAGNEGQDEANRRIAKLVGELKHGRDIIERQLAILKRNESELKKQNERLDFTLRSANIGLWDIDPSSGRNYVSESWFGMFGLERDAVPDPVPAWESALPEDRKDLIEQFRGFIEGREEAFSAEYGIISKDRKEIWLSDSAFALSRTDSGSPARYLRSFVITERLKNAYGYLKEANKKMNMMSSIIRHDALNQVTGMMIFMDMLKELTGDDDDLKRYVEQIDGGMNSIHDKLVFTRDYHGLGEYEPEWQDVRGVIEEVLPEIEMGGISVGMDLDVLEIYSDPLLRMVFMRLIENTVKHGEKATGIGISYMIDDDGCRIVLEDDGIGIPAKEKTQIFRNGYGKNAGYGLFLVQQLLSITGINIVETGEEGQGARFEILVPEGMYRLKQPGGG